MSNVKGGAIRMDDAKPDWYRTINKDTLDIESDTNCIGGQCFGSFGMMQKAMNMTDEEAEELGFNILAVNLVANFVYGLRDMGFQRLRDEWIAEIDERLQFDAEVRGLNAADRVLLEV